MSLSQAQQAMVEKVRALGGGIQGVALSESMCVYVLATIVADLDLKSAFPELPAEVPAFFGSHAGDTRDISAVSFLPLLERLISLVPDADMYFASLAQMYKTRIKYERILNSQPLPTMEQVGPRALLEFGKLSPQALGALIVWRKWIFDIDNRAAQETGLLFEPIIAGAIGGISASANKSPVRRHGNPGKGRQVDCIKGNRAYEFKLRVTMAASGQGRWREELNYPLDCRESGFVPVLIVLDATPSAKLGELRQAFEEQQGEVYVGEAAWMHLNEMAGATMATFLKRYVQAPIQRVLDDIPPSLPDFALRIETKGISVNIGDESFMIFRQRGQEAKNHTALLPDDENGETSEP